MRWPAMLRLLACGLLVATGLQATPGCAHAAASAANDGTGRSTIALKDGWRFRFGGDANGVTAPGYDDHDWQSVALPHTWNRLGEYRLEPSAQSNDSHGIGWYRLRFDAPARRDGHVQILQFDAVGNVAQVWLNGILVGRHEGAFARFRLDVSAALKPGARNVLVVQADNSKPASGSATENVVPLAGDFFVHGGIYRMATLIDTDAAQIDMFDHAGPGVYISTPTIDADAAAVEVQVKLRNLGPRARKLDVLTTLSDAAGQVLASDTIGVTLDALTTTQLPRRLTLPQPRLWRGRADAYLYRATVSLREHGRLIDQVVQPFGVRSFHFDADNGFSLNGTPLPLHGASRHQDRLDQGWALSPADHAQDMAIMAEMGVNTVRGAHYQHAQEWFDAADESGMVVWAEIPFVHQSALENGAPPAALVANAQSQLLELIRQNYNHPSIVIWSVGNEVDIRPTQLGSSVRAQSLGMLQALNATAKREDPGRATAYADCCENAQAIAGSQILSNVTDVTGYNRYFGWYYGSPEGIGPALDTLHARYPAMPIAVSEYGAGGALSQHSDNPRGGPVSVFGRPHPEEYQSWVHEQAWQALASRRYLSAVWIWNMFDFPSDLRQEGDAIYLNDKGLVSFDRTQRKDAFYFYQAQWSQAPVLHITGKRYVERAYPVIDVRVYSNAERASLSVNGVDRGETACPLRICVWPGVALQPGGNSVRVTATIAGETLSDTAEWQAPDAGSGLRIDAGSLSGVTLADGARFGSDNFFSGGEGLRLNAEVHGPAPAPAQKQIVGSDAPLLFDSYREGHFSYRLPLPDGRWRVSLYFAEPDPALAGTRRFTVKADGRTVLSRFSPAQSAGGALKAVVRRFPVQVKNGVLVLDFVPDGGPAMVAAITVTPE